MLWNLVRRKRGENANLLIAHMECFAVVSIHCQEGFDFTSNTNCREQERHRTLLLLIWKDVLTLKVTYIIKDAE